MLFRSRIFILTMMPAIFVIMSTLVSYVTIRVADFTLKIHGYFADIDGFWSLRFAKAAAVVLLISGMISSFSAEGMKLFSDNINFVFSNIVSILSFIAAVCGLSVIDFYFKKRLPIGVVRLAVYLGAILFSVLVSGVTLELLLIIGVVDSFIKLRVTKIESTLQ